MFKTTLAVALMACLLFASSAGAAPAFQPTRFSVDVRGSGPDVLLIPGLASSREVWTDTARRFGAGRRLHLIQVAGFGGLPAGPNAEGPLLQPLVEELHRYLADRGLSHVAVIGHSMGGLIGLMLAKAHPEDVGRLMVVDALPFYALVFSPAATAASVEPIAAQLRDNTLAMTPEAFAQVEAQTVARLSRSPDGQKAALAWALASDRRVLARASYEDITTDVRGDLSAIRAPVTVLYAWDPAMGPAEAVDGLYAGAYAALPDKTLARIDASFHFIPLDQPAAFAAKVQAFLDRAPK